MIRFCYKIESRVCICYRGASIDEGFKGPSQDHGDDDGDHNHVQKKKMFLVPQYVVDEEMKNKRYHDMLRDGIMEFVSMLGCGNLEDKIARAWEHEIELELQKKCKPVMVQTAEGPTKRPKTSDSRFKGQQGWVYCGNCGKSHDGSCRSVGLGYYRCGMTSHVSRDYPQGSALICFHCNQTGHKKSNFLRLLVGVVGAHT